MDVLVENPLLVELKSVEKRLGMHAVCTLISFVLFVSFVVIKSIPRHSPRLWTPHGGSSGEPTPCRVEER